MCGNNNCSSHNDDIFDINDSNDYYSDIYHDDNHDFNHQSPIHENANDNTNDNYCNFYNGGQ